MNAPQPPQTPGTMLRSLLALLLLALLFGAIFFRWPETETQWESLWAYDIVLVDAQGRPCFPDLVTQEAALTELSDYLDDQDMPLEEPLFDPGCEFSGPLTSDRKTSKLKIAVTEHATKAKVMAAFADIGITVSVEIPKDREAIITIEAADDYLGRRPDVAE